MRITSAPNGGQFAVWDPTPEVEEFLQSLADEATPSRWDAGFNPGINAWVVSYQAKEAIKRHLNGQPLALPVHVPTQRGTKALTSVHGAGGDA